MFAVDRVDFTCGYWKTQTVRLLLLDQGDKSVDRW
jgi:hypothetical protein